MGGVPVDPVGEGPARVLGGGGVAKGAWGGSEDSYVGAGGGTGEMGGEVTVTSVPQRGQGT